jgi:hypothetical protein
MKILELDGRPFVRLGSKTLSPVDALQHCGALVREAEAMVAQADQFRDEVRHEYRAALTDPTRTFDRASQVAAEAKCQSARGDHAAAQAQVDECRALVADHGAKARVAAVEADVHRVLSRFPLEVAHES